MDSNQQTRIREAAYFIWKSENKPDGKELDHWLRAERNMRSENNLTAQTNFDSDSSDQEGIRAARQFERSAQDFEYSGKADAKAEEAKRAIEGPEASALRDAEEEGKKRRKGEDKAGNR
jgi:Protein of unknown function (DUF2934)